MLLPGKYGAHFIFGYAEDFATPRVWAEALTLLAITLRLQQRPRAAAAALLLALAVHPLVAAVGVLCVVALPWSAATLRRAAIGCALAGLLALGVAILAPIGPLRLMDDEWLGALRKMTPYLFTDQWTLLDWQRVAVPLSTLAIAWIALPASSTRDLARLLLLLATAGTLVALLASGGAPVILLIQGQPWRWLWLARALAVLLLVPLAATLWSRGLPGRATLALLGVAWFGAEDALGLEAALCAVLAAGLALRPPGAWRHWPWIALALAALAAAAIYNLVGLGTTLPLAVGASLYVAAVQATTARRWQAGLAAVAAVLCALQIKAALERPLAVNYDEFAAAFAPWQAHIPLDASVLATSNAAFPGLSLHRRGYVGNIGAVFSREATLLEVARSQRLIDVSGHAAEWFGPHAGGPGHDGPTVSTLQRICALPELDYVLIPTPLAAPRHAAIRGLEAPLYLYACADVPRPTI